jgi:hypothetical protein
VEDLLVYVYDAIVEDFPLPQDLTESLPHSDIKTLTRAINKLKNAGYSGHLAENGHPHYEERAGTGNLAKINEALNHFATAIAEVIPSYLNVVLNREGKRIKGAIQFMMETLIHDLHVQAVEVAGGQFSLTLPSLSELQHSFEPIRASFHMQAGFSTTSSTRQEKVGRSWEKVGEKRNWKTLFLTKTDVYDYVDKYEKRSFDAADIPAFVDIMDDCVNQILPQMEQYNGEVRGQVRGKLDESVRLVTQSQRDNLSDFRQRLNEAQAELGEEFRANQEPWETLKSTFNKLQERIEEFKI